MKKSLFFVLLLVIASCTEEETTSREYPRLLTKGVSDITADGATFHGEIIYSSGDITDHGFLWCGADYNPELDNADKISLGDKNGIGTFQAIADRCMQKGEEYAMRPYVQSSNFIVYGEVVKFTSEGSKNHPVISDFNPTSGQEGDIVTIHGNYFSEVAGQNQVFFGDLNAEIISFNENELTVKVPLLPANNSSVNITVVVEGNSAVSQDAFELEPLEIFSLTPSSAVIAKTQVEINGNGFGTSAGSLSIKFGSSECVVNSFSPTKIVITLPPDAPVGSYPIVIETNGVVQESATNLTSVSPWTLESQMMDHWVDTRFAPIVVGDKVYVKFQTEFWEFDITNKTWKRKADAPVNAGGVSFSLDEKVHFVVQGITNIYDPASNSWSALSAPDLDFDGASSASLSNSGYAFLGTAPSKVQHYDPVTDQWQSLSQTSVHNFNFYHSAGFLLDQTMYLGLGYDSFDQKKFWKYNITTDTWTPLKNFSGPARHDGLAFVVDGKGYLGGGYEFWGDQLSDFWEYNHLADSWKRLADLPGEIVSAGSFSHSGKGYVFSNSQGGGVSVYSYDPNMN